MAKRGDKRRGLPVAKRLFCDDTLTSPSPPITTGHLRIGPSFVDENEPTRVESQHLHLPPSALCLHVGAILFRRVDYFFLKVICS